MAEPFRRGARDPGHAPGEPALYVAALHREDLEETRPAEAASGGIRVGEAPGRARQPSSPPRWLITRRRPGSAEVLAIGGVTREPTLPVFGSREGAQEFLHSYASRGGWEAAPIGIGELLSLLCGACAEAGRVALDPLPEIIDEGAIDLVSFPRQSFVDSLLGRGRAWFEDRYREGGQAHG